MTLKDAPGTQNTLNCASKQEVSFSVLEIFVITGLISQSLKIEAQITLSSLGLPEGFIMCCRSCAAMRVHNIALQGNEQ